MSDNPGDAVEAAEDTSSAVDPEEITKPEPDESPHSEAAKYRRRLRDAEAERDTLAARLANMQRAQIDSHITALGLKPAAVWASGTELADLVDDDGVPDEQAVAAAVENARDHLGLRISKGNVIPGIGNQPTQPPKTDAWQEAFGPRRGR
jgi:hypothetical protein